MIIVDVNNIVESVMQTVENLERKTIEDYDGDIHVNEDGTFVIRNGHIINYRNQTMIFSRKKTYLGSYILGYDHQLA